jgi:hypothetical protein
MRKATSAILCDGGKPCIRGMRVTVGMIVGQLGAGRGPLLPLGLLIQRPVNRTSLVSTHGPSRSAAR